MTKRFADVAVNTISTEARCSSSVERSQASRPYCPASSRALQSERFATMTTGNSYAIRYLAVSSPTSPTPMMSARLPSVAPRRANAKSTAIWPIETGCLPRSVSVRTFFPKCRARWNHTLMSLSVVCASHAALYARLTWPNISASPKISESSPQTTSNRCLIAISSA